MPVADQYWLLGRALLLGLVVALYVMQYVPDGETREVTVEFSHVARSTYLSVYLVTDDNKYAVLVDNEKVDDFLYDYRNGGKVEALVRPGNGIVELRHAGELLYSLDEYDRAWVQPKAMPRRWMYFACAALILSFIVRPKLI